MDPNEIQARLLAAFPELREPVSDDDAFEHWVKLIAELGKLMK